MVISCRFYGYGLLKSRHCNILGRIIHFRPLSQVNKCTGGNMRTNQSLKAIVAIISLVILVTVECPSSQTVMDSLVNDISAVQAEIRQAEEDDQKFTGGLIKSLILLRLATLRQTLAILEQYGKARTTHTTLQFTIDGRTFVPPADAAQQIVEVEKELAENAIKIAKQEAEAERYTGGLVKSTILATVATLRHTQAMLEQKRLSLKYSLPQYIGFKDALPSPPTASTPQANISTPSVGPAQNDQQAAQPQIPSDCMKVVFGAFCLGAPTSSLPPNPSRKTDETWLYLEPKPTMVTFVEDRICSVGRIYSPGTWLTYTSVETELVEKYGKGKDLSFFPTYAKDSSSKETAISLKKGRAVRSWQQQGYTIQLKWENQDNVVLIYFHDELEAKREAKKKDQL